MKQLEVDLDQLELTINQLTELREFMDNSFTQDKTEEEEFKSKLLKQSFEITISYLVFTQSMIKKFQQEKTIDFIEQERKRIEGHYESKSDIIDANDK